MNQEEIRIMESKNEIDIDSLKICDDSVNKMNLAIIRKHNERVKKEDIVYFLGDFGFSASSVQAFRGEGQPYNSDDLIEQMNGKRWNFVMGNHDKKSNKLKTKTNEIILKQNDLNIQLIHDPTYAKIDYDLILCGHVHQNWKIKELHYYGKSRLIINVGVDVWNMMPINLDEILVIYYRWQSQRNKIAKWETPSIIKDINN